MALLSLLEITKGYDAERPLLKNATLVVRDDERMGLIGPNGAGKSTLLRLFAGAEAPESGKRVARRGLRIGYLEQEPRFAPGDTIREVVAGALEERRALLAELEGIHAALGEAPPAEELERLLRRQGHLQERLDAQGGHDVEHLVAATISGVGLRDPEATCGSLSGGEARRVALARLLVGAPDLLLLDEPTNHLDAFVIAWLEQKLQELRVPFVLVTHDRYLLDRTVRTIVEIDRGELHVYDADPDGGGRGGSYARYLEARAARLEAEAHAERVRLNQLRRETAWMRRGPPARTTKAKARIARYEELVESAPEAALDELDLEFHPGRPLGTRVIALSGVSHRYGDRVVLPRLDLELTPGMRLGVVGPNGAGKSTLLRILLQRMTPSEGEVSCGETVRLATIDQDRGDLDPEKSVVREIAGASDHVAVGDRRIHVASFLDAFLFPGRRKDVLVRSLSGGERGRILLAKLLLAGGNVIVLDEPTNDLDLATLRALEEALVAFEGSVVVVSHDRWFLDRVATHVLHLDGRGGARLHTGSVSSLFEKLVTEKEPEPEQRRPPTAAARKEHPSKDAAATKKLSPWEKRELDELTERIAELEEALARLDDGLADPELYRSSGGGSDGGQAVRDLRAERERTTRSLEEAMSRWEELAERDV